MIHLRSASITFKSALQSSFASSSTSFVDNADLAFPQIASSTITLVILTKDCLSRTPFLPPFSHILESAFVKSIEYAKLNSKIVVLHPFNKNNPFPPVESQPSSIRDIFVDKAITFLSGIFTSHNT